MDLKIFLSQFSGIPKEYIPIISCGLAFAGIFLIIISLVVGVAYLNYASRPKAPIRHQPSVKPTTNTQQEQKIRYEDLPIISGRIGEILALSGLLKVGETTKIFLQILDILKRSTYDLRWRYKIPFFMILGENKSGKSTIINRLNIEELTDESINSMWKLFKNGIIFEPPKSDMTEKNYWSFLAELFLFIRPRRPLDGIIVTVPADIFLSNNNASAIKSAKDTFENIFQFQRDIGFRLPIYVIVSKSDKIKGFSSFAHLIHHDMKQQMFGWSNPYTLNTAFSQTWIDEIFSTLTDGINNATMSFAYEKSQSDVLNDALLFPVHFQKIRTTLSDYLNTIFKSHSPSDGLIFRGIYFVGEQKTAKTSAESVLEINALAPKNNSGIELSLSSNNSLYFLQDLFSEKIFKEANIAHPIHKETTDMRQTEFKKQAVYVSVTATLVFGWLYGNYNIRTKISQYTLELYDVRDSLEKISRIEKSLTGVNDKASVDRYTGELLQNMPKVKWYDFFSVFVPQSWFSNIRKNIIDTINLAFDSIVTRAIYIDLNLGTHKFLSTANDSEKTIGIKTDLFDINSFDSFQKLRNFSSQIKQMRKMGQQYNLMIKKGDGKEIINITKEIFKEQFATDPELKNHTPNKHLIPPKFDMNLFKTNAEQSLKIVFQNFLHDAMDPLIPRILQNVTDDINLLLNASRNALTEYSTQNLAKLYHKCTLVQDMFKNKNFAWIKRQHFVPNSEYANIMNELRVSDFVSNDYITKLLSLGEIEFAKFKSSLCEYKTELTEELIQNNLQSPSEQFNSFVKELKFLLDKPFICTAPYGKLVAPVPDEKMLIWDQKRLGELSKLIDKYYEFSEDAPEELRQQFFDDYKNIAKKCFYPVIQSMLGSAEIFYDIPLGQARKLLEESYKKQSSNIRAVTVHIPKIVKLINEIQSNDNLPDCGVIQMIVNHYMELLQRIDALFNAEKPYSARTAIFDSWDGDNSPKYLDISNQNDLRQYLSMQFAHIKFLAKDLAEPVVDLLSIETIKEHVQNTSLLEKWKDIITSVDDYIQKKPGNSISALEDFISQTLKKVEIDTFDEKGDIKDISDAGGDYFIQTRSSVAKSLLSRADEVKYDRASKVYMQISDFFNNNLKGKAPFDNSEEDASLRDIEILIQKYDKGAKNARNILKKHQEAKDVNQDAIDFLETLDKAMPFLKLWLQHSKGNDENSALVLFKLETRPEPSMEANVSAVIDRNFNINDKKISNSENVLYFNKDAVDVSFKWIEAADDKPQQISVADLKSDGVTASFKQTGKWALFKLIGQHKMNSDTDNPNGVLLKFEIPTEQQENTDETSKTTIVMKLTPLKKDGDKFTQITWPIFPKFAPDLHKEKQNEAQSLNDGNNNQDNEPDLETSNSDNGEQE